MLFTENRYARNGNTTSTEQGTNSYARKES